MAAENQSDERTMTVEVRGVEFEVNTSAARSWRAVKLYRKFNEKTSDQFLKLDLSFELIEMITGCTENQIVEYAGGQDAPATDVVNFAAELVAAINPKN